MDRHLEFLASRADDLANDCSLIALSAQEAPRRTERTEWMVRDLKHSVEETQRYLGYLAKQYHRSAGERATLETQAIAVSVDALMAVLPSIREEADLAFARGDSRDAIAGSIRQSMLEAENSLLSVRNATRAAAVGEPRRMGAI